MILDSSAVVAILLGEPERASLLAAIEAADQLRISAATYVESAAVIDSYRDPVLSRRLDELLVALDVQVMPFDLEQASIARAAYRDFGRGSGHSARLNFGDCLSYAAAKSANEPLLWIGDDFTHTDLRA